jgi:hypothetical protein
LGIKTSKEAYESALSKLNYVKDTSPSGGTSDDYIYNYGEVQEISTSLTSEELTSFFNYNRPDYYALKKVQIKINPDDTVEVSAAINTDYFLDTVLGGKYSKEEITQAYPLIKVIPDTVNIYGVLSGEIVDNKSSNIELSDIEVMGVELPSSLYETSSAQSEISNVLDDFLEKTTEKTGGTCDSLKVQNGELMLDAKIPSSLTREGGN